MVIKNAHSMSQRWQDKWAEQALIPWVTNTESCNKDRHTHRSAQHTASTCPFHMSLVVSALHAFVMNATRFEGVESFCKKFAGKRRTGLGHTCPIWCQKLLGMFSKNLSWEAQATGQKMLIPSEKKKEKVSGGATIQAQLHPTCEAQVLPLGHHCTYTKCNEQ